MKDNIYDSLKEIQMDAMREVASIGAGNAATALSSIIAREVIIEVPKIFVLDFDHALKLLGDPETIVSGIMVKISGDINGIILFLQQLDFINVILESVLNRSVCDYRELNEMDRSALTEIGNIVISSYMNAFTTLTGLDISLSVPAMCLNMAGGILTVPIAEYGYDTNKIMIMEGEFKCDGKRVESKLLVAPDVESLRVILKKLGVVSE